MIAQALNGLVQSAMGRNKDQNAPNFLYWSQDNKVSIPWHFPHKQNLWSRIPSAYTDSTEPHLTNCMGNNGHENGKQSWWSTRDAETRTDFILAVLYIYYVTNSIVKEYLFGCIKVNAINKPRKSYDFPESKQNQSEYKQSIIFCCIGYMLAYVGHTVSYTFWLALLSSIGKHTNLSSLPSKGLEGSGSLFRVLQPFRPFTDTPAIEACPMINCHLYNVDGMHCTHGKWGAWRKRKETSI